MPKLSHILLLFLINLFGQSALAAALIEKNDRLEINWSTQKFRFYGEATIGVGQDSYKDAEKQAWRDGMSYVSDAVRSLNLLINEAEGVSADRLAEDAKTAAKQVAQTTYSHSTTYFGDGGVRVLLENQLPRALDSSAIKFRRQEAVEPILNQYTGIIFKLSASMKPAPAYQIVDEEGKVLFDVKDMAAVSYRKNLMGRWFKRATQDEILEAVGKGPIEVPAKPVGGKIVVSRNDWENLVGGHQGLLVSGLIALTQP